MKKFHNSPITKKMEPCSGNCKYGESNAVHIKAGSSYEAEEKFAQATYAARVEKSGSHRKSKIFPNLLEGEAAVFKQKVRELSEVFDNYEHEYNYSPDERPGEREFIENYDPKKYTDRDVSQTADNIILWVDPDDEKLKVLMIQRGGHPYKGSWAHPGGFIDEGESRHQAASRELFEETGVTIEPDKMRPVETYDRPGRDPRMDVRMNTHVVLVPERLNFAPADDAADAKFIPVEEIYDGSHAAAFDHKLSIRDALRYVLKS